MSALEQVQPVSLADRLSRRAPRVLRFAGAALLAAAAAGLFAHAGEQRIALALPALLLAMLAAALAVGRVGRFLVDWFFVLAGFLTYTLGSQAIDQFRLATHYGPQIELERLLFAGQIPTLWLQQHLFHGDVGVLELYAFAAYVSHFLGPPLLGFYLWWTRRRHAFRDLMLTLLAASLVAEAVFLTTPTAPPWLAAETGYLPPVHHLLKLDLARLGFTAGSQQIGNPDRYDIVAALPSLHIAWPFTGLLVCRRYRLPAWVSAAVALQLLSVLFAIVYDGDHYVVDALAGMLLALVVFLLRPRLTALLAARTVRLRERAEGWKGRAHAA